MERSEKETYHVPVLLKESVDALGIRPDGIYVDVTMGGGGHSREILSRLGPKGRLIAFDQDSDALANAPKDGRLTVVHHNFRYLADYIGYMGVGYVDGVLGDLGVSSHHFDAAERGFSIRAEGPLDMRMNREGRVTAADIVATYDVERLTGILATWGEVNQPKRIAGAIVKARAEAPIVSTTELREVIDRNVPRNDQGKTVTKVFQALRIEVNREMDALETMLRGAVSVLRPGSGRVVMIAYHSLEDRMVKNLMRSGDPMKSEPERDAITGDSDTPFEVSQRKPTVPSSEEIERNPRARSAKLRWAERWAK